MAKAKAKAKAKPKANPKPKMDTKKLEQESRKTAAKVLAGSGLPKELIARIEKDEVTLLALANVLADVNEQDREVRAVVDELADVAPEITKLEEVLEAVQGKVKRTKADLDAAYKREHQAVIRLRAIRAGNYQTTMEVAEGAQKREAAIADGAAAIDKGLRAAQADMLAATLEELATRDECEALADLMVDPKVIKGGVTAARIAKSLWNSGSKVKKKAAIVMLDRLVARGPLVEVVGAGGKVTFHLKTDTI